MTLQPQTTCDLFRGPPGIKTAPHSGHNVRVSDQLAMHRTPFFVAVLRDNCVITSLFRDFFIAVVVSIDLSLDRGGCSCQIVSYLFDGYLRFEPFGQIAPLVEVQVRVIASRKLTPCNAISG